MKITLFFILFGGQLFAQSIELNDAQLSSPSDDHIAFIEFRNAKAESVLELIRLKGKLQTTHKISVGKLINLRLVDTTWPEILQAVISETGTPDSTPALEISGD
ncbi:MAG: hypothetical protein V4534_00490 [Myxococcota bacterium]